MEKDFDYYGLNEVMGVPDPDRTEQLINTILNKIDEDLHKYFYVHSLKTGFVVDESVVSGSFMLSGDLNICPWLDENTEVFYRYDLKSNRFMKSARFVPILGDTDVYVNADGIRKIRYSKIVLDFAFGTDCIHDPSKIQDRYNEIKVILRHELQHAYNELMKHENVPLIDDQSSEYGIVNPTKFMQGYNVVVGRIMKKEYESNEEKNLLYAMYLINKLEMNANVAGFYQRLINDYDKTGRIGNIESYDEYVNYKNAVDFLDMFSDQDLFELYKDVIKYMCGSFVKGINKFRSCLRSKAEKFFKKIEKLHKNLSRDIDECSEKIDIRLHEARNLYIKKNRERLVGRDSNLDESEKMIIDLVAGQYVYTDADYYLGLLDKWFSIGNK